MREFGDRPIEGAVDQHLAEGVVEVIVAADHMADSHVVVVDDDRQIVGRRAVGAQDDQIVEFAVRHRDFALHTVADRRRALLRCLEADRRLDAGRRLGRVAVAPSAVIAHRAPLGARAFAHRRQFLGRTIAVIGAAHFQQPVRHLGMSGGALELVDDLPVPGEAQPFEPVDDRGDRLRRRSNPVGVLDAQAELTAVMAREEPVEESGAGAADVQKAGRGGGEADGDRHERQIGRVGGEAIPRAFSP